MNGKSIRKERDTLKMTRKYKIKKSGNSDITTIHLYLSRGKTQY